MYKTLSWDKLPTSTCLTDFFHQQYHSFNPKKPGSIQIALSLSIPEDDLFAAFSSIYSLLSNKKPPFPTHPHSVQWAVLRAGSSFLAQAFWRVSTARFMRIMLDEEICTEKTNRKNRTWTNAKPIATDLLWLSSSVAISSFSACGFPPWLMLSLKMKLLVILSNSNKSPHPTHPGSRIQASSSRFQSSHITMTFTYLIFECLATSSTMS